MTFELEKDLQEALAKHLPQAASDLLQQRLKKADIDAEKVTIQNAHINDLKAQLNELHKQLETAKSELKEHAALDVREAAVAEKERNAEIAALTVQLTASQSNTKFAQDVAMGLVRNTEFRRSVFDSENRSDPIVRDGYQQGTTSTTSTSSSNTTDTVS